MGALVTSYITSEQKLSESQFGCFIITSHMSQDSFTGLNSRSYKLDLRLLPISLTNWAVQRRNLAYSLDSNKIISLLSLRQMASPPPTADVTAALTEDGSQMHCHSEVCPDVWDSCTQLSPFQHCLFVPADFPLVVDVNYHSVFGLFQDWNRQQQTKTFKNKFTFMLTPSYILS